jgi:hypothetical protein
LQRKCACGGTPGPTGECDACRKKKLQRYSENLNPSSIIHPPSSLSEAPPIVHEALRSGGQPLDAETRTFMEPRFGHDFSKVRVHADARAAESAEAVNSLAYAVGHDIVFGANQYAPGSAPGRHLLAHELTHTLQQSASAGAVRTRLRIGAPDDVQEREAERQAAQVLEAREAEPVSRPVLTPARSLQRQPKTGGSAKKSPKARQGPCMTLATVHNFSRGNDDPSECNYETAYITIGLLSDPCACSGTATVRPLRLKYKALLGGKNYNDRAKKTLETQASTFASAMRLRDPAGAISAPLIHTPIDDTPEKMGDPGDTLEQTLDLSATVPCAGGAANGTVQLVLPRSATTLELHETIKWSIDTSGGVVKASLSLEEGPLGDQREKTDTMDLTAGGKKYPKFPGESRIKGCICNPVTGVQYQKDGKTPCNPKSPPAQVGSGTGTTAPPKKP